MLKTIMFWFNGHDKTYKLICKDPPPSTIMWAKVLALLIACGVEHVPGSGDATYIRLGEEKDEIEESDPKRLASPTSIKRVRNFLKRARVTPETIWTFVEKAGKTS